MQRELSNQSTEKGPNGTSVPKFIIKANARSFADPLAPGFAQWKGIREA
jgi:hypothetical protein